MLDFLSVGLAAGSNPNNNDPGEAQIAVPPKTKLYSSTQHLNSCCSNFRNTKFSNRYSTLPLTIFTAVLLHHWSRSTKTHSFQVLILHTGRELQVMGNFLFLFFTVANSETQNQSRRRWVPGPSSHQNSWASDPNLKRGRAPQNIDELALKRFAMIASPSSSSPPSSPSSPFFFALFLLLSTLVQVLLHTWTLATSRS